MRNYISVNAKHYKKKEINRISEHNFRLQKIGYLLPKEHIKYENVNIIYSNNLINKYENNLTKLGEYSQNLNELYNKKQLDNILKSQYQHLLKTKENIQYKNKSYAKNNESTLVEMVVALSEEQAKFYLESGQDLGKGFDNFTKNLCEKYGFTPLQVSLHLDEGHVKNGVAIFNVHAHLTLFNFNFEKERSVLRTLKKQDYRDLQDMASLSFQEVGFNFVRGESKAITGNEHLEKNDHVIQQQEIEINQQIKKINQLKNNEKELLKKLDKGTLEYDEKYKEIGILQQQEKNLRSKVKELSLNTSQEFNSVVSDLTNNLVNKHIEKNLLGNKVINNIDDLKKDIFKEIKNAQNLKLVIKEFDILKQENQALKSDLKQKEDQNSIILDKLNEERSKNKVLEQDKGQNLAQNQKLLQGLEKQQKMLLRQNRTNTRLRKQRQRLVQKSIRDNNFKSIMQIRKILRDNKTRDINKNKIKKTNEIYDRNR